MAALVVLSGLAGGGIALKTVGATSSTPPLSERVKYWCVASEASSTEIYLERAPVAGMHCFDNPTDAEQAFDRAIGIDPALIKGVQNGSLPQSPGSSANGRTCTASLPPGGSTFEIAYAKCAGGRTVITFYTPPHARSAGTTRH
jgi:hypothetical protein